MLQVFKYSQYKRSLIGTYICVLFPVQMFLGVSATSKLAFLQSEFTVTKLRRDRTIIFQIVNKICPLNSSTSFACGLLNTYFTLLDLSVSIILIDIGISNNLLDTFWVTKNAVDSNKDMTTICWVVKISCKVCNDIWQSAVMHTYCLYSTTFHLPSVVVAYVQW